MREMNEDAICLGREFFCERDQIAAMDFDSRVEGIEWIGLGEDHGGGARTGDGIGGKGKQRGGRVVGDQQDTLAFPAFFNRRAAWSDQIDYHAGGEDRIAWKINSERIG